MPRDVASRAAKEVCDEGRGVGPGGYGVYLDLPTPSSGRRADTIREKYGNLFEIYERITGENAYEVPDADLPGRALHDGRPLGRLPVDVQPSRAFRRRRGQLLRPGGQPPGGQRPMQGLADGYFILPATVPNYLASATPEKVDTSHPAFAQAEARSASASIPCSKPGASAPSTASTANWAS